MDPNWVAALCSILATLLMIGGFFLANASWKGKTENRLDTLEVERKDAHDSRTAIHNKVDDISSSMQLQFSAVHSQIGELVGELRGRGVINGRKK